jgi:putative flippase GtrA
VTGTRRRAGRLYEAHGEKLRYLVVGTCNTLLSYGLFVMLLALLGNPLHALSSSTVPILALAGRNYYILVQWVAWVLAVPPNALTMRHFAFRSTGNWRHQVFRAYFIYLPAQGLSSVVLLLTVRVAHLTPQVGQLAAVAVATVFTYLGHKYFTFREPPEGGEVPPRERYGEGVSRQVANGTHADRQDD